MKTNNYYGAGKLGYIAIKREVTRGTAIKPSRYIRVEATGKTMQEAWQDLHKALSELMEAFKNCFIKR